MYEDKKRFIEKSMDLQFSIYNQRKAMCNDIRGKEMNADGTVSHESHASSVIMAKNSCSLISPSWSRSNSSIMAWLEQDKGYD